MNRPTLFDRLESYAQENFATEILAYILQSNEVARKGFVDLILSGRSKKLRAAFHECDIVTQCAYDIGKPDLRITSRTDTQKPIFVEVKVKAQEGRDQVERYKKRGYVALLAPELLHMHEGDEFLGHFFWYQVYNVIHSIKSKNEIHRQFLKYLEVRNMGPSKPITSRDLRRSIDAVGIIRKFQEVVSGVRQKVDPQWRELFGKNAGAKQVSDGIGMGCLPFWWYRDKGWKKQGVGSFYLEVGIEVHERTPHFYLGIASSQKKFANTFESKSVARFQKLKKHGWKNDSNPEWDWCYARFFPLGRGPIDQVAGKQTTNVMAATTDLRRSGIIEAMKKAIAR